MLLSTLHIAGGVALLLYAVRYLRKGLDRLFGPSLGAWMQRLGRTPLRAFLAGLMVAIVAPSSTTVSLLAVSAVSAGHMTTRQMLLVMLGANLGLTVTVQVLALEIQDYAAIVILAGVGLFQFTSRSLTRGIGQVLLALGFLFLAIGIIQGTVERADLGANADFQELLALASKYPLALATLAALMALGLQSSTATIAVAMGFSAAGAMTFVPALSVVIGANVGMSITTMLLGWQRTETRRLAFANLLLKLVVAIMALVVISTAGVRLNPDQATLGVWIAQAHTGFNLIVALLGLALVGPLTSLVAYLMPMRASEQRQTFGPKFISDGPMDGVALALGLSRREILHVSEIVREMLRDIWRALEQNDSALALAAGNRDDQVDLLDARIKRFLTRVVREETDDRSAQEQMQQLRYLSELETAGDIVDKNLSELVQKKIRLRTEFSREGWQELREFYRLVLEGMDLADAVFSTRDHELAQQLVRAKERLGRLENELRDRHFQRLNAGLTESHETSAIHLDLLTHLKRMSSGLAHVAFAVLQEGAA